MGMQEQVAVGGRACCLAVYHHSQQTRLQQLRLTFSFKEIGPNGLFAESALPDRMLDIVVSTNLPKTLTHAAVWITTLIVGVALGVYFKPAIEFIIRLYEYAEAIALRYMPPEEALGILADMAFRVIRKTFDGEDAVGAARLFCDEVIHAVEHANHRSR
jgi:hypothetical protein